MRLCLKIFIILLLPVVSMAQNKPIDYPVKNLRVPLEKYANGVVKTRLFAAEAKIPFSGRGKIEGRMVVVERLARDGVTVEMSIEADDCVYDRVREKGVCKGKVVMKTRGLRIEGVGLEWSRGDEMITIPSDARIEFDRGFIPVKRIKL